ncbi:putative mucin-associated surface protein (MASP) [Trypanosoma cruzi]|nr:putative mucin-associated surface protein (MASP) [Trypanosoma cruzi]
MTRNRLFFPLLLLLSCSVIVGANATEKKASTPRKAEGVQPQSVSPSSSFPGDGTGVPLKLELGELRDKALLAAKDAFGNTTGASMQCMQAKTDVEETKKYAEEAKKLFDKIGGDYVSKSAALADAVKASTDAEEALKSCVEAEKAAVDADTAVLAAVLEVLQHSKFWRRDTAVSTEKLANVSKHSANATNEAQKAGIQASKAAEAAKRAAESKKKAAAALDTVKEVVAMAEMLKEKFLENERLQKEKHEAQLEAERRFIQEEVQKKEAEAEKALNRAAAADKRVAELELARQKQSKEQGNEGRGHRRVRRSGSDSSSNYAPAYEPRLLLLPLLSFTLFCFVAWC